MRDAGVADDADHAAEHDLPVAAGGAVKPKVSRLARINVGKVPRWLIWPEASIGVSLTRPPDTEIIQW